MTGRRRDVIAMLALSLSAACAWSDPGNRPIWNAFEGRVVPAEGPWFYATLPMTVPVGFAAILGDTLVAHPLQVVDDAARDVGDLWRTSEMDFESEYFTQLGSLPLRAALTPAVFGVSWCFRSAFAVPAHEAEPSEDERSERMSGHALGSLIGLASLSVGVLLFSVSFAFKRRERRLELGSRAIMHD